MFSINRQRIGVATALIVAAVTFFGLPMFIPVAQAEQAFDITMCYSGTFTILSASKELTVLSYDLKGISRSNHENKVFDNTTGHAVGVMRRVAGKANYAGYFKLLNPDGDFVVVEISTAETGQNTWKFLQGTGKWKGITGGSKSRPITHGKYITPGTFQKCIRVTGTFELPPK